MHNHENSRRFAKFFRLLGSALSTLFWVLLIFGFDEPLFAGLSIISAIIHEFGHEFYLFCFYKDSVFARGALSGLRIRKVGFYTYREEFFLYASGVISNLAFALLSLPFIPLFGDYIRLFCLLNVATALSNLLPIEGYDGYGILHSVASYFGKEDSFVRIFSVISLSLTSLLCFLSLYMMERFDAGYWIFAVFILSLISKLKNRLKS